jgi:hypothetical protein
LLPPRPQTPPLLLLLLLLLILLLPLLLLVVALLLILLLLLLLLLLVVLLLLLRPSCTNRRSSICGKGCKSRRVDALILWYLACAEGRLTPWALASCCCKCWFLSGLLLLPAVATAHVGSTKDIISNRARMLFLLSKCKLFRSLDCGCAATAGMWRCWKGLTGGR